MNSYSNRNWSQSRLIQEGVELWEIGEPLNGGRGRPLGSFSVSSTTAGSQTPSSGESCSSGGSTDRLRRELHNSPIWESEVYFGRNNIMSFRSYNTPQNRFSYNQNLTRSSSFWGDYSGLKNGRSSSGTLRPPGWSGQGILGQGGTLPRKEYRRMHSLPPYLKVPKAPRPEKALQVSSAAGRGLRECINTTRQDLISIRDTHDDYRMAKSEGRLYEIDKQLKSAERYLKQLEFLLSKMEDLNDQYSLNQRLRDGVSTMAYAYTLSSGKEKSSALSNVRSGYKECTDTLCDLEFQMEQMVGTLMFEMKGIQGFSRVCPGDVFEVVIKHGVQKWKTKGRIAKDNSQIWNNATYNFKVLLGYGLKIKVKEVKLLGKTVSIGCKVCETKDLFSSHPQIVNVDINQSGSLKLSLVITWLPLDGCSDETLTRTPSFSAASPRLQRKLHGVNSSPPSLSRYQGYCNKDCASSEGDRDSSFGSMSYRSSTADSASPSCEYRRMSIRQFDNSSLVSEVVSLSNRTDSPDSLHPDAQDCESLHGYQPETFTLVRKEKMSLKTRYSMYDAASSLDKTSSSFPNLNEEGAPRQKISPARSHPTGWCGRLKTADDQTLVEGAESLQWAESLPWDGNIPDTLPRVVTRLKLQLEDIQGQFPQLQILEDAVLELQYLSSVSRPRRDSNTSEISLSVESALECFDFLNAESEDDFGDDNLEECLAKNRKESLIGTHVKKSASPPCTQLITGSPHIDSFLLIHLKHALLLFHNLGSFGPLRRKEKDSLHKLEVEGKLLSKLLSHKQNFDSIKPQHIIPVPHVQVLWDFVASEEEWCVPGKSVVDGLLPVVSSLIEPKDDDVAKQVLQELVRQMTNSEVYTDILTVTVGHFLNDLIRPLQQTVPQTADCIKCAHLLSLKDHKSVEDGVSLLKNANLIHTKLLSRHLNNTEISIKLLDMIKKNSNKTILINSLFDNCLLMLEATNPDDRAAACALMGELLPIMPTSLFESGDDRAEKITPANAMDRTDTRNSIDKKSKNESDIDKKLQNEAHSSGQTCAKHDEHAMQPIILWSYLQQNDPSEKVRTIAKENLLKLGTAGTQALQQMQLSSNGFQGVDIMDHSEKTTYHKVAENVDPLT